jgi:hypothetical protein
MILASSFFIFAFLPMGAGIGLFSLGRLRFTLRVKISGFTFIRNGNALGYPFVPSIHSLLPLVDEMIVNVPQSTDRTLETVKAINDPKIRILESEWDEEQRTAGLALSHHTNLALGQCTGDWCVYLQGDEVLHEVGIPVMRETMEKTLHNPAVQGLLVDYTHFYGSYWTYASSFGWYQHEVRIVRRDRTIRSCGRAIRPTRGRSLLPNRPSLVCRSNHIECDRCVRCCGPSVPCLDCGNVAGRTSQ